MMKRFAVFGIIAASLAGCATTAGFEKVMNSYLGHNVNDFIAATGYAPQQVLPDGSGKLYVFGASSTGYYQLPQTTTASVTGYGNSAYGTATTSGGGTIPINRQCSWTFRTRADGTIHTWNARGNACVN
jgi:predicted small secreted protein